MTMWAFTITYEDIDTITIRLIAAAVLAGFIGLEREMKRHPAGLRTHILVGVGSCLMMILSLFGFQAYIDSGENIRFDPARIPSYVISGIGFLGAGTILVHGRTVRGLTTAASIWVVAGIGLIVGAGMYYEAVLATVIVVLSLFFLNKIETLYAKKRNKKQLTVVTRSDAFRIDELAAILEDKNVNVDHLSIDKARNGGEHRLRYLFSCTYKHDRDMERAIEEISKYDHVVQVVHGKDQSSG